MGIYKKGRPRKAHPDDLSCVPHSSGEYRIKDSKDNHAYIGETSDLKRRLKEHRKSGKFQDDDFVEYMEADGRSTSRTRRKHEQKSIEKHKPYRNSSVGGEGRIAGRKNKTEFEEPYRKPSLIRKLLKLALKLVITAIIVCVILYFLF